MAEERNRSADCGAVQTRQRRPDRGRLSRIPIPVIRPARYKKLANGLTAWPATVLATPWRGQELGQGSRASLWWIPSDGEAASWSSGFWSVPL